MVALIFALSSLVAWQLMAGGLLAALCCPVDLRGSPRGAGRPSTTPSDMLPKTVRSIFDVAMMER